MTVNIITEPFYRKTVWCRETLNGMERKIHSLRYELLERTEDDISGELGQLVVIGTSPAWVSKILNRCAEVCVQPLVISCQPLEVTANISCILVNHEAATVECIEYLRSCGRERIALYGVNRNSYADTVKKRHFLQEDVYCIGGADALQHCFDQFILKRGKYNAVICTNYASAVHLINRLKNCDVQLPEELYIVTYGDSVLGRRITPSLTTITLDHEQLGVQAVLLYKYLYRNEKDISFTVSVPCKIVEGASTEYKPFRPKRSSSDTFNIETDEFLEDSAVMTLQCLEKLLRESEPMDLAIIDYMLSKVSYSSMADHLYVSESSIKYRLKRMLHISGFADIPKMLEAYAEYLK